MLNSPSSAVSISGSNSALNSLSNQTNGDVNTATTPTPTTANSVGSQSNNRFSFSQSPNLKAKLLNVRSWRAVLVQQLQQRNTQQTVGFEHLIESHAKHSELMAESTLQIASLKKEVGILESENKELKHQLALSKDHGEVSNALAYREKIATLEEKLLKTQEELTESYKLKGQNAQMLWDLSQQVKAQEEELRSRASKLQAAETKITTMERQLEDLAAQCTESKTTLQILTDEHQALQLEFVMVQEKSIKLEAENKSLVERWLRKVAEEAEKMNELNKMHESLIEFKKREALMDAAQDKLGSVPSPDESSGSIRRRGLSGGIIIIPTTPVHKISAHDGEVTSLAYSFNGSHFATGGSDKLVKIWDSKSGKSYMTLSGSSQGILGVAFSSKGDMVAVGGNDHSIRTWAVQTGRPRHTLNGHIGKVYAAKFCGDSTKIISGSHDRTIKIWDLSKGYCMKTIFSFSSCNDIVLGDDSGSTIISGHVDNHIRFWDSRSGECVNEITGIHTGQITSLDLSSDGKVLLSNSRDNTLKLIDVRMLQVVSTLFDSNYRPGMNWAKACFSPDGHYVAAGNGDGSILHWDALTSQLEKTVKEYNSPVAAVAWHPQGHQVISCDKDKNVVIWE